MAPSPFSFGRISLTDSLRTPLYALHLEFGARMVPFAGYEMPVQYPPGIIAEHRHVRSHAGLFDVSHMGQVRISGADAALALETLLPADIAGLAPGRQRYTFFTTANGGILDDLMVANDGGELVLVVNAACTASDLARLRSLEPRCHVGLLEDRALLALQGPGAVGVMQRLAPAAAALGFMGAAHSSVGGLACFVSRSGYTGEDGFEISVAAGDAERLARLLLAEKGVAPVGLGARDSLRLEAGLPLYGHDIDESTTPVEAGLAWAIPKVRRPGGARAGGFPGDQAIVAQLAAGAQRTRVGVVPEGRAPVREGAVLHDALGRPVGKVTSGGFGASIDGPVAMAYVEPGFAAPGTQLTALSRGKPRACRVATLPFFPHRYYRGAGQ